VTEPSRSQNPAEIAGTGPTSIAVALIGAGPWAEKAYAPMLAAGPETRLAAVWSRRPEAAQALAAAHGSVAVETFDAALARCEAVAFAVPPDVQAELGIRAARAGKALLLDKPLALTLEAAERLTRAVEDAGVVTQLMLTHRFRSRTASFIEQAHTWDTIGGRLAFLSSAFLRGPYACAWRKEHGALHDLGPHAFDLLEAAVGPIESIAGRGDPRRYVALGCRHANGAVIDVALSGAMPIESSVFRVDLYGPRGTLEFDAVAASVEEPWAEVRRRFAEAYRLGRSAGLDVHRGLSIQRLIDRAMRALA
jgi:predicted dehydrogenase